MNTIPTLRKAILPPSNVGTFICLFGFSHEADIGVMKMLLNRMCTCARYMLISNSWPDEPTEDGELFCYPHDIMTLHFDVVRFRSDFDRVLIFEMSSIDVYLRLTCYKYAIHPFGATHRLFCWEVALFVFCQM